MSESVSIKKDDGDFIKITYSQENTEDFVAFQWLFDLLSYLFMTIGITLVAAVVTLIILGEDNVTTLVKCIL